MNDKQQMEPRKRNQQFCHKMGIKMVKAGKKAGSGVKWAQDYVTSFKPGKFRPNCQHPSTGRSDLKRPPPKKKEQEKKGTRESQFGMMRVRFQ